MGVRQSCEACEGSLAPGARFCRTCGTAVGSFVPDGAGRSDQPDSDSAPSGLRSRPGLAIGGVVVALALTVAAVAIAFGGGGGEPRAGDARSTGTGPGADSTVERAEEDASPAGEGIADAAGVGGVDVVGAFGAGDSQLAVYLTSDGTDVWYTRDFTGEVWHLDPLDPIGSPSVTAILPINGTGIAAADDGLWMVDPSESRLVHLASDSLAEIGSIPFSPAATLPAADGDTLWVSSRDDGTITRVDVGTGTIATTIDVGAPPGGLAVEGDDLWITDPDTDTLSLVDGNTGDVIEAVEVGSVPRGVAIGAGGIWVAESGDATVSRLDPDTLEVTHTTPVGDYGDAEPGEESFFGGPEPSQLAIVDDTIWVGDGVGLAFWKLVVSR